MPEPITTASKGPSTGFCFQDVPMRFARASLQARRLLKSGPDRHHFALPPSGGGPGQRVTSTTGCPSGRWRKAAAFMQ
jgi:hypothetical protein